MTDKKQQEAVIKKIHKSLNIPENYYIAPIVYQRRSRKWGSNPAPDPDPLDHGTRRKALHQLCKAKIIDEPSLYPVLERMVDRLDKMMAVSDRKKYLEKLGK
jgi:hypothetical protein